MAALNNAFRCQIRISSSESLKKAAKCAVRDSVDNSARRNRIETEESDFMLTTGSNQDSSDGEIDEGELNADAIAYKEKIRLPGNGPLRLDKPLKFREDMYAIFFMT